MTDQQKFEELYYSLNIPIAKAITNGGEHILVGDCGFLNANFNDKVKPEMNLYMKINFDNKGNFKNMEINERKGSVKNSIENQLYDLIFNK